MASQPPDPPAITLITSSLSVVQPVGLPPATPVISFPSFDENPNQDPRAHIQSFSNAVVMSLVNDDCYASLWFSSTLNGKALEWFWSNCTASFPTWTSLRDAFLRKFETVVDQRGALIVLCQLKQRED